MGAAGEYFRLDPLPDARIRQQSGGLSLLDSPTGRPLLDQPGLRHDNHDRELPPVTQHHGLCHQRRPPDLLFHRLREDVLPVRRDDEFFLAIRDLQVAGLVQLLLVRHKSGSRARVLEHERHLIGGEIRVDGDVHQPGHHHRVIGQRPFHPGMREEADVLAPRIAQGSQTQGESSHALTDHTA